MVAKLSLWQGAGLVLLAIKYGRIVHYKKSSIYGKLETDKGCM